MPTISDTAHTCPPTICVVDSTVFEMTISPNARPVLDTSSETFRSQPVFDPFEDEINHDPGAYFLSPNSDDDWDPEDDDFEWDAGIHDFSLYTEQKKNGFTEETKEQWRALEATQADLRRRLDKSQSDSAIQVRSKSPAEEDTPGLTPDHSPSMLDDLDPILPTEDAALDRPYFTFIVTPPQEDYAEEALEDDEEPLFMRFRRKPPTAWREAQRPSLLHSSRTLSGKRHSWSPPGLHTVLERPDEDAIEHMNIIGR